jgi:hypothetical protein
MVRRSPFPVAVLVPVVRQGPDIFIRGPIHAENLPS